MSMRAKVDSDADMRRTWIFLNLELTVARGMILDKIPEKGFNAIDDMDLREWLFARSPLNTGPHKKQGDDLAFWSPPLQTFYDAAFCYEDGDVSNPRVGAGIATLAILRILFSYKGSIVYYMQAGMGDTVFAPMYLVLRARGVKFHFFHRVENLKLAADKKSVAEVRICQQVKLNDGEYRPLVDVKALPCWPSEPLWDQIVNGEQIKASGVNLEHYNSEPQPKAGEINLKAGVDFDRVVLGATLACLPDIAGELVDASQRWRAMCSHMKSVQTQAMQIWFDRTRLEMGLPGPPSVRTAYIEPWSSITDFSHLLPREDWPQDSDVNFLIYSCGVLRHEAGEEQQAENDAVKNRAVEFLNNHVKTAVAGCLFVARPEWNRLVNAAFGH